MLPVGPGPMPAEHRQKCQLNGTIDILAPFTSVNELLS